MKKTFIISLTLLIALTACKKKDTAAPVTTSTPPPSTDYVGWLRVYNQYQYTLWNFQESPMNSFARAYFTTTAINLSSTSFTYTYGGQVIANNLDTLQYITGSYEQNIAAMAYTSPVAWKVAGNGTVPAFTATCSLAFPACTGYTTFPTTVSKSVGVTYTITNFTNTNRIIVEMSDGNGQNLFQHPATISGGVATVNFPGSETANFSNGGNGYVNVYLYNEELKSISGKNYKFSAVKENYINGFTIVN